MSIRTNAETPTNPGGSTTDVRTGAEVLVETLASAGVTEVFGIPGEHCLALTDAVDLHGSMRFISVRHESSAAFMAEAHGKLTGIPAACLGTASVGAANLMAGVNVAHHDSTPMVTIIGQISTSLLGREAWQEVDLVSLFKPICRDTVELSRSETLAERTARAIALGRTNRPGPVMLSVPVDVQEGPASTANSDVVNVRRAAPSTDDLREILDLLHASRRPLLVVGGGIRASGAAADLAELAEQACLPVVTGFRRTDAFPNDSDYYVGALGLSASDGVRDAVLSADLLIIIGTRLSELTTLRYAFPMDGQRCVHVDADAATLATQQSAADIALVSDAAAMVRGLRDECARAGFTGPAPWWRTYRQTRDEFLTESTVSELGKRMTRRIAQDIDRLLPADGIVTSDAGDFFLDCAPVIGFDEQRRFLGPTSGTMGYGLPSAIAAKNASPDSVCVALCGDGGLMMSIQEIETAVRYRLGVVVVAFNNYAYGSIIRHQADRFAGNSVGTKLSNPSFADLADLFGATGHLVESADEFAKAFTAAITSDCVDVIEVRL